ncbi:hypothetical protein HDV00_003205 [Rhizophlyctis rosea]|nr:hypothetical protein HDV00_003205 [Rhizophlyctis rosea]
MSTKATLRVKPTRGRGGSRGASNGPPRLRISAADKNKKGKEAEVVDEEAEVPIEEHFILRMPPGQPAKTLREKVSAREVPEDVFFKFVDSRRAEFHMGEQNFQAKLVDLPCIIESQKTLDSKQFYKIADICQMLVVEDRPPVADPAPLPPQSANPDEFIWPDGLTPPLKNVRKRRFRKRMSKRAIEDVEREVERLLQADANAADTRFDLKTPQEMEEEEADDELHEEQADDEEDIDLDGEGEGEGEGEVYEGAGADEDDLLAEELLDVSDDEDDESEAESADEMDEEERQRRAELANLRNEIEEMKSRLDEKRAEVERHINPLMKQRSVAAVNSLADEIAKRKNRLADISK